MPTLSERLVQGLASLLLVMTMLTSTAHADSVTANPLPASLRQALPDLRTQGQAEFRYFGFLVYEASLWYSQATQQPPYALHLAYKQTISAADLAKVSRKELARIQGVTQTDVDNWMRQLGPLLPDVKDGDALTLVRYDNRLSLYFDGKLRGEVADARLARAYLDIWIGAQTNYPKLRRDLLGEGTRT
jgi:hypothetical protein